MSYQDLYLLLPDSTKFDLFSSFSTNVYLTKLLIEPHSMNNLFEETMEGVLKQLSNNKCNVARAPVKQEERCIIQSQTDYGDRQLRRKCH